MKEEGMNLLAGRVPSFTMSVSTQHEKWRTFEMDQAQLEKLAHQAYQMGGQAIPQQPDEEDAWRAEMQAAGVPEPLQELMTDLRKEVEGAMGAELWSDPKEQARLLCGRLWHYRKQLWRFLTGLPLDGYET